MDYRKYKELLERYFKLDQVRFGCGDTKEEVIGKLMDISRQKKQIKTDNNAIIREYIEKYEKSPELLDDEGEALLKDFLAVIMPNQSFLDPPIALRISKLLLGYYRAAGDLERSISMLEFCTVLEIIMKEHLDDYAGSEYAQMAEQYLPEFDRLSERGKRSLANCWLLSVINRKDMTFGLRRYREIKGQFEKIRQKLGEDFMAGQYVMCKMNALSFALEACRRAEYAQKNGTKPEEPVLDMEKDGPLMEEIAGELEAVLESDHVQSMVSDRVLMRLYCAQAAYHLGKITLEELLGRFEKYSSGEDYNTMEMCSALFTANAYYLDYMYKCGRFEERYVQEKSVEIVGHVLAEAKEMERHLGNYQTNSCVLMFVYSASNIMDFNFFKSTVLGATVYANKALYVHTMMVKEICRVFLAYIAEHHPQYLDGVGGRSWEYWKEHGQENAELMENCALFHDIGKYFCLDYVSNSSRNLTDDEFEIVKTHSANFSKIYQGAMTPETACIRDCALLHHLWYNEQGGYPKGKHTFNKPFVNIISIADSIDAATDNIGRPYGQGKTLSELSEEFDGMGETRYSGFICSLLHVEEVRREVEYIIEVRRKEIYCEIYLGTAA